MTIELFKTFVDLSTGATAIALVLSLYKFRSRSPEVKIQALDFFLLVLLMLITEIVAPRGRDMNIPMNLASLPGIILPLIMYDFAWNHRYRIMTIVSIATFCLFALCNFLFIQQADFNSYTLQLGGILIVVHSIVFYYYLLVNLPVQKLHRLPMFWFNAAYLLYYASTMFIFAAYMVEVFRDSLMLYWTIQNVLRTIHLCIIMVGLGQDLRNLKLSSS